MVEQVKIIEIKQEKNNEVMHKITTVEDFRNGGFDLDLFDLDRSKFNSETIVVILFILEKKRFNVFIFFKHFIY